MLQQGELTDLRGSYGAVECPPSTLGTTLLLVLVLFVTVADNVELSCNGSCYLACQFTILTHNARALVQVPSESIFILPYSCPNSAFSLPHTFPVGSWPSLTAWIKSF